MSLIGAYASLESVEDIVCDTTEPETPESMEDFDARQLTKHSSITDKIMKNIPFIAMCL